MADGEEVTLDGRPLQALRVADLKAALEQRGLPKSGQKSALIKRLRGALMLENLQKHSTPHTTFQPNSQIGEEMSQNTIIKQYLEKQQELLRQRLEREAREAADLESKSCIISRKRDESDEEETRKLEEHLSRVRQSRAVKTAGSGHALVSEEREISLRSRRAAQRVPVKEEEEEEEDAPPLLVGQTPMRLEEPGMPAPQETGMFQASLPIVLQAQQTETPSQTPDSPSGKAAMPVLAHLQRSEDEEAQPLATVPREKQQVALTPEESPKEKDPLPDPPKEVAPQLPEALTMETEEEPGLPKELRSTETPQEEKEKEEMEQGKTPVAVVLQKEGEPQSEETPEAEVTQALHNLEEEASAAAAALVQASPSPPQLIEAQQSQQDPRGDEPPPPLLTKEAPAGLVPTEDEAPPQLSKPSPPAQEAPAAASLGASPSSLALPPHQPGSSRSSSSSSSNSSRSRSRSPGSSPPQPRGRRTHSASSESPARKRPALESRSRSGSERRSSSGSRSRSSSRGSRSSSSSSSKSRRREASRDSTSFPTTKEPSLPEAQVPPHSPKAQHQESPSSPREEGRKRTPSPPPRQHSHTPQQQQPARTMQAKSIFPERDSPEPLIPTEGSDLEIGALGSEPSRTIELPDSKIEEKQTMPMEMSEPPPENEGLEPGGPEDQPSADPQGPEAGPEDEEKKEGSAQPKAFKRKISVSSSVAKGAVTTKSDTEGSQPVGRKRRWGASTATTQKKPSISITTESLKSLIPEIKSPPGGQEAVVDLHADDSRISEDEAERHLEEPAHEKALKICRTVTQVVPVEGQENGQGEEEEEEEEEEKVHEEEQPELAPVIAVETVVLPPPVEHEVKKVTLSDTLTRRSISQQRSGVSITIDDPVRTAQVPSPPRGKVSCIVHICNLVRPFTLGQLKELLGRTGTLVEEAFWIDKIKSHCYVTYSTVEEAVATRNALHGVKWPQSNPKFLSADFVEQDELDFHRGLLADRPTEAKTDEAPTFPGVGPTTRGERELSRRSEAREREAAVREQWAEREREMERRERTLAEREWDRDKVREGPRSRSRSRERRRKERPKSKEKKAEKKEKAQEEPPAKLLDDLFRKTKAAPCIYWLPLTDIQCVQKQAERAARARERERRRKELEAEEARQRERNRQAERDKRREHSRERERERPNATSGGGASRAGDRGGRGDRERREAKSRHSRSRSRSTPVQDRGGRR